MTQVTLHDTPSPRPVEAPPEVAPEANRLEQAITALIAFGPFLCLIYAAAHEWHRVALRDALLAVALYAITGHGVTVGFHRAFTHRSFRPNRALKIGLAVAGSMAFEGAVIPWVANHRRHHAFADRPGDPHSPCPTDDHSRLRGFWHAHMGWLFASTATSADRYAPDLMADRDLVVISRLFPALCVVSLAIPFAVGWSLGGHLTAGLTTMLWAGGVRIAVLHHVTWSINSVCHTFGKRPFATRDRSTDFAPLAVVSFGESWHNGHHASPRCARHASRRFQYDSSASFIRLFERFGWARDVHWRRAGSAFHS